MSKNVYKIWCEYDIGLEETVFESMDKAFDVAERRYNAQWYEGLETFEELKQDALIGIETWDLV